MYFLGKIHPYISVFDKVTALLILWEFEYRIDSKIHNDSINVSVQLYPY